MNSDGYSNRLVLLPLVASGLTAGIGVVQQLARHDQGALTVAVPQRDPQVGEDQVRAAAITDNEGRLLGPFACLPNSPEVGMPLKRFGMKLGHVSVATLQATGRRCSDGVDGYFDSTAGSISDEVTARFRTYASVVDYGTAIVGSWEPA